MIDTGGVERPQPASPTPSSSGHPPDVYQRLVDIVRAIRAQTVFRTSSAMVRWTLLVIGIGLGAALLIALAVQLMVSLLPGGG